MASSALPAPADCAAKMTFRRVFKGSSPEFIEISVHENSDLGSYEIRQLDERSEEHTSELQSQSNLVCRLLLEKKTNFIPALATARCSCAAASSSCGFPSSHFIFVDTTNPTDGDVWRGALIADTHSVASVV